MQDIKYPIVDRSNVKPNFIKRDSEDQIDISFAQGIFSDGRTFRAEFWAANQVSYLTYYFSKYPFAINIPTLIPMMNKSTSGALFFDSNTAMIAMIIPARISAISESGTTHSTE